MPFYARPAIDRASLRDAFSARARAFASNPFLTDWFWDVTHGLAHLSHPYGGFRRRSHGRRNNVCRGDPPQAKGRWAGHAPSTRLITFRSEKNVRRGVRLVRSAWLT